MRKITMILAAVVLMLPILFVNEAQACVQCKAVTRERTGVFACVSAASGGKECSTSTGQTQCALVGVCVTGFAGEECSEGSIGRVEISRDMIDRVADHGGSKTFADALAYASEGRILGSDGLAVHTFEYGSEVRIGFAVERGKGDIPIAITMTRSDSLAQLRLVLEQRVDALVSDGDQWAVTGWAFK